LEVPEEKDVSEMRVRGWECAVAAGRTTCDCVTYAENLLVERSLDTPCGLVRATLRVHFKPYTPAFGFVSAGPEGPSRLFEVLVETWIHVPEAFASTCRDAAFVVELPVREKFERIVQEIAGELGRRYRAAVLRSLLDGEFRKTLGDSLGVKNGLVPALFRGAIAQVLR
jgi:hypothetical protein